MFIHLYYDAMLLKSFYSLVALFQEDALKILGDILEELYGPLPSSRTVNGVARSMCTVSELSSVNVAGDSDGSCTLVNSSSRLSELAAAHAQSSVANLFLPSKSSDLTSDVISHPSNVPRAWSAGTLVTDGSGKSVQVNVMLFAFSVSSYMFTLLLLFMFCSIG